MTNKIKHYLYHRKIKKDLQRHLIYCYQCEYCSKKIVNPNCIWAINGDVYHKCFSSDCVIYKNK